MPFLLSSQNVLEYLIALGLCTPEEQSLSKIELKPAKNFNLLISLPENRQLLVKQERLDREGKSVGEFFDEWKIHNFLRRFPEISYICSSCSEVLHFDAANSIIVFNYLSNYRDLADYYTKENLFPTEIARIIGATLAAIHHGTINRQDYQEFIQNIEGASSKKIIDLNLGIDRITPEIYGRVPADGLKFFALYQRYDSLGQAIADLSSAFTPCCLTHNDLKLNNILLSLNWEEAILPESLGYDSIIRLIDWERGAWGDPANDLGTLVASYLQIWLHSLVTSNLIAIQESLRLATIPLQLLQPSITMLVSSYLANFPEILELRPDFIERVMQFCGLALIRAIQAQLQHQKTFGNVGICMLQVAKSLLCRSEASIQTIFGVEASDLYPTSLSSV
ncbi:aminoglycoside phosphotransferase family protein [Nostocaceae cyanobacterium CENA369]|uniref:Aminoglycoside phosphotransferase family protein n=1 Tax=Dendronalium phyllosphericum CENA369 TaxID=1725256 RepID=A0A8J7LEC0_9NOST|nr:phosphotransferase [Dendronalium phyllosphericum]MBH8574016.1 aminoglycoside phosphotransferase family protein [Dendronalium phyllosphericum CENA369]